jgi:mannose-1-phosphate guanylyltransferase
MVLCAGLGKRLLPLSSWTAKPLVPVGDRPALARILEQVRIFEGATVINAHHHADQLRAFLEREDPNVRVSYEKELLDTGGGVHQGVGLLGGTPDALLVWNGDALVDLDVHALRVAHAMSPGAAGATLVVGPGAPGNIGIDAGGRVVRIRQETVLPGEVRGCDFLCVQVIGGELLGRLPARGGLVEDFYLPLLADGVVLRAWETRAPFHDIGTLSVYRAANLAWLAGRRIASFVADDAHVADGVTLELSIVGQGARVEGEGTLARCVVWPGAHAVAPLEGAIVTPFGVVTE